MKIEIKIDNRTANHLESPHTFYSCCVESEIVLKKVQKEIDKQLNKRIKKQNGKTTKKKW